MLAIRLKEGQDLKQAICAFVLEKKLSSASVVSAVGSLSTATIRMAGASPGNQDIRSYEGVFEIVSLTGTIDAQGNAHLHIAISDKEGAVTGGHLKDGSIIHTTVELTLVSDKQLHFIREMDRSTGFDELTIKELN